MSPMSAELPLADTTANIAVRNSAALGFVTSTSEFRFKWPDTPMAPDRVG
jgi:hypothetical protein